MSFLIEITGLSGEVLRKIEVDPGQIVRLQPEEQRVVFLQLDPGAAKVEPFGDTVQVSISGQEAMIFEGFSLYLEDGTATFLFSDGGGGLSSFDSDPQELSEIDTADDDVAPLSGGAGSDGSVNPGPFKSTGSFDASPVLLTSVSVSLPVSFGLPAWREGNSSGSSSSGSSDSQGWGFYGVDPNAVNDAYDVDDTIADKNSDPGVTSARALLANDTGGIAPAIFDVTMTDALLGEVWLDKNGNVVLRPNESFLRLAEFQTEDIQFTYTIVDARGVKATATVTVTVIGSQRGDDLFGGTKGNDKINGGEGDDTLFGDKGKDRLSGGDGNDKIGGGADNDILDGGRGDDWLKGGKGNDWLKGGKGNDWLKGGKGDDWLEGNSGIDTVDYSQADSRVIVHIIDGADEDGYGYKDRFKDIEIIRGSKHDDFMTTSGSNTTLYGGDGGDVLELEKGGSNNVLYGEDGNDTLLLYFSKNNTLYGGDGDDFLIAAGGDNNVLYGGNGDDILGITRGNDSNNVLYGGDGDDILSGSSGKSKLYGGDGDDILKIIASKNSTQHGGKGTDTAVHSWGSDRVEVNLDTGTSYLQSGGKRFQNKHSSIEDVVGSWGNDNIIGDYLKNTLSGWAGSDTLNGGEGDDKLWGFYDSIRNIGDIIYPGTDEHSDIFVLSGGDDTIKDFDSNANRSDKLKIGDIFDDIFDGDDPILKTWGNDIILSFDSDGDGSHDATMTLEDVYTGSRFKDSYSDLGSLSQALEDLLRYSGDDNLIIA